MSAKVETVEDSVKKNLKKRKHEGEIKESKKKRKALNETAETNGADELESRSEKKEKRKKKDRSAVTENSTEVEDAPEPVEPARKEKKKKKKLEQLPKVSAEPEVQQSESQNDIELPDAPSLEEKPALDADDWNAAQEQEEIDVDHLPSLAPSAFHTKRMSLYLPIPPIGLDKAIASMLTLHITPLLLTYFPPAGGVVLSVHDPVLSATPQDALNQPLLPPHGNGRSKDASHAFPKVGDEFGSCWAWLTVTFLVYSPQRGDRLSGWTNAMSEGFIGLVCYNYFQTSIAKSRIPDNWSWSGPTRETRQRKTPRKGKLNDGEGPSQDSQTDSQETIVAREDDAIDGTAGTFLDGNGSKISERLQFRVIDLEMIPAQERGQLALQVEGSLLNEEDEARARQEEYEKFELRMSKSRAKSRMPGTPVMSGGLAAHSRASSVMSRP